MHVNADLIFTTIETYAARTAATTILVLWLYRHMKREFQRRD